MRFPEIRLDTWWLTILSFGAIALHLAGLGLALHVLMRGRSPQGTVAWILVLLLWPYLSVFLYLAFGLRRFHGYTDARRFGREDINRLGSELAAQAAAAGLRRELEDLDLQTISALARMPPIGGNRIELLVDGEATFASILAGIAAAQTTVVVQTFILRADSLGGRLATVLLERAAAGVRCHLLYDQIGSHALPRRYLRRLRAGGVAVSSFNTRRGILHRFRVNFRNHRKVVVVDGSSAWVGGHNVGDEYLGRSRRFGPWRDTHLRIDGPAALACQLSFTEDWFWATGALPDLPWAVPPERGAADLVVVPTGPADPIESGTLLFLQAITGARERLWIASPYFVPDHAVASALQLAALRGVDVRIMLPANPDKLAVWLAAHTFLPELTAAGVCFFAYQDGFMHQKVLLVDQRFAAVSTANLDNRSLAINFEITLCSPDQVFIQQVETMLAHDFDRCRPFTAQAYLGRHFPFRALARLCRLLAPIL